MSVGGASPAGGAGASTTATTTASSTTATTTAGTTGTTTAPGTTGTTSQAGQTNRSTVNGQTDASNGPAPTRDATALGQPALATRFTNAIVEAQNEETARVQQPTVPDEPTMVQHAWDGLESYWNETRIEAVDAFESLAEKLS
jgi:hypothetical protein